MQKRQTLHITNWGLEFGFGAYFAPISIQISHMHSYTHTHTSTHPVDHKWKTVCIVSAQKKEKEPKPSKRRMNGIKQNKARPTRKTKDHTCDKEKQKPQ